MADRTGGDTAAVLDEAAKRIEAKDYQAAIDLLNENGAGGDPGEREALSGLAHYLSGNYARAAEQYSAALKAQPGNPDWELMHERSAANAEAEISTFVPSISYFEREHLLAPPDVPEGSLPRPRRRRRPRPVKRIRLLVSHKVGTVITVVVDGVILVTGKVLGYKDEVWTNWYRRRVFIGVLTLGYMRMLLNKNNLKNTYPKGELVGFQQRGQEPPPGVTHFRTADGSWNNLDDPKEGAAGTRFPRNVRSSAIKPETGERLMTPNPREISRRLLARRGEMKEVPFLNMLAASWINFQNHDWISHGQPLMREIHEIPLAEDDPARLRYRQKNIFVGKTQPDPTRRDGNEPAPISFINEVTHWWDGSQIYGSDHETVERLRSHVDGRLRLNAEGTLPLDDDGIEMTGFTRNWWIGLAMLHTLFAQEHNAICDMLKGAHPDWDDQRLFHTARLINAAVMAKIHSVEWTPAILPNPALSDALHANWYGVLTNLLRSGDDKKTLADINIRNPEMGGVVGNPINAHGEPYGLTQEFVEVYRLHPLLPETLAMRHAGDGAEGAEDVPFPAARQAGSGKLTKRFPMADQFYSFGIQHPGQLVLKNYPQFMLDLSIPGNPVYDMGAVDILRARERGVPRYNQFRRELGLNPIRSWEDLTTDPENLRDLREVYGDGPGAVEDLDLLVGTLAEEVRPTGFGFGETLFQIFILNASRRLQADRFFTDSYNAETYSKEGLEWIDRADLKTVILRHYPELAQTGLANITNAFEPWDTDRTLDPARHPLREYDKELRPDPWLGDAYRT
jgi:hypothetical protein